MAFLCITTNALFSDLPYAYVDHANTITGYHRYLIRSTNFKNKARSSQPKKVKYTHVTELISRDNIFR